MTDREEALVILEGAIPRVDRIVVPWGFQFELIKNDVAHLAYACGQYKRGNTEIELIYRLRRGWGAINYQVHLHTQAGFVIEREVLALGHPGLMRRLGHENDSHLIESDYGSVARGGGDPIEAFIHDLEHYGSRVLSTECKEFVDILRTGYRRSSVELT